MSLYYYNKFLLIQGYDVHIPTEAQEGMINEEGITPLYQPNTDPPKLFISGVLSITDVEVLDVISEGLIDGLVTGEYTNYQGTLENVGWDSADYSVYADAPGLAGNVKYLRSIYWNEVPVLNASNQFNFQRIDTSFTPGYPEGSLVDSANPNLTISRTIGERLRGGINGAEVDAQGNPTDNNTDINKYYRIYNKECIGAIINIKISLLSETLTENAEVFGNILPYVIRFEFAYREMFSDNLKTASEWKQKVIVSTKGKINYGFIHSTQIDFDDPPINEKDFLGFEIRIIRISRDELQTTAGQQLTEDASHPQGKAQSITYIDSLTEIYAESYRYPNSAIVRSRFNAEFFTQVPSRAFDAKLLRIKLPNNYNPILKSYGDSRNVGTENTPVAQGADFWDGNFATDPNIVVTSSSSSSSSVQGLNIENAYYQWSDNPAWCFYDLLTNNRYGLGQYIDESLVDKWTLYKIGKYCDTLVNDGYGNPEPRFTCNLIINSREEAWKVLNDFASIFNTIIYYSAGLIYTSQDSPKVIKTHFTNANVEDGNFNYSSTAKKARHTVAIVRYNDKLNFYKPAVEYVEDIDGIRRYGVRETELTAFGCTSRGQAARLGRWALLSENLETETVNFTAGFEAIILRPGYVFSIFDSNRKLKRHSGRIYNIINSPSTSTVTLDNDIITDIDPNISYEFSIVTPTFFYDSSQISDLNSDDIVNIDRSFIQTQSIPGTDFSSVNGKTVIAAAGWDAANYIVTGLQVWSLQPVVPVGDYQSSQSYTDINYDLYRTLQIQEKEPGKYTVLGLQYFSGKYDQIESGLGFERPELTTWGRTPDAPTSLIITLRANGSDNSQLDYVFTGPSNIAGVSYYKVFAIQGSFPDANVPDQANLIATLPITVTNGTFVAPTSGIWTFRIYSYNAESQRYSLYIEQSSDTTTVRARILNYVLGGLGSNSQGSFLSPAGSSGASGVSGTSGHSGTVTTTTPQLSWQLGIQTPRVDMPAPRFRFTVRQSNTSAVPSDVIYYQASGVTNTYFDFDVQSNFEAGMRRSYDVVVEAIDISGRTSAGNDLSTATTLLPDGTSPWTNVLGYDKFTVINPQLSGYYLTSGNFNAEYTLNNHTIPSVQWIDTNGAVHITITSGIILPSIEGCVVHSSTGIFTTLDITGSLPRRFPITTEIIDFSDAEKQTPLYIVSRKAGLTNVASGYVSIGLFDEFDLLYSTYVDQLLETGIYITNCVPASCSGNIGLLNVQDRIRFSLLDNAGSGHSIKTIRTNDGINENKTGAYIALISLDPSTSGAIIKSYLSPV